MYTFDYPNRQGTYSYKWNVADGVLPMWVADMDIATAPEITEALQRRVSHGIFGYTDLPDEWYDAYIGWWKRRHDFAIDRSWLRFSTGVVPTISSAVRKLTTPNENVVILTPVYNIFFNSIVNNGCRALQCPLQYVDGEYHIDWTDLETKLSDPQTTLMIFCNPHNPVGKIWSAEEMSKIGELCHRHGVTVISDEIHCDVVAPGRSYVPFAAASDICRDISITCISPTKAFNLAGIQTSALFAADPHLRHKITRAINTDEVAEPNCFAVTAAVTAFDRCGEWLDNLCRQLFANRAYAEKYIDENIPSIDYVRADATYLMWLDVSSWGMSSTAATAFLRDKAGLYLSDGSIFGASGEGYLRMNLATSPANITEAMERLRRGADGVDSRVDR